MSMTTHKAQLRGLYGALALLSLIGLAIVVHRTLTLIPVLVNGYQPPAAGSPTASRFAALDDIFAHFPVLTLLHVVPALLFVVLGPIQFNARIRSRHPAWHRRSGRVFLVCAAIIGLTALVMSLWMPAIGGFNQAAATTVFSVFFLVALFKAFRHILRRNVALHREWMIRAYAIGLAVATIRLINAVFFAISPLTGLTVEEFFGTGFWIGFVLNLIVAEAWIYHTRAEK